MLYIATKIIAPLYLCALCVSAVNLFNPRDAENAEALGIIT
jgi:hypothetical protein